MSDRRLRMRQFSQIESTHTDWLLDQRIPLSEVTLLAGMPGEGKSTWLCQIAAQVSCGAIGGEAANVLFASGEDSVEKTLHPRLVAAGADLDRVFFIDAVEGEDEAYTGSFRLPSDADLLREQIEASQARLLIIDPLFSHLDAGLESSKDESMRRAMKPLTVLAQQYELAIVVAHHLNKRAEFDPLMRIGGSLGGIAGPVRSIFLWGADKANAEQRLLVHVKHNLSKKQPTQAYVLESARVKLSDGHYGEVSKTELVGEDERGSEAVFGGEGPRSAGAVDAAIEFLLAELSEGELEASQVFADATAAGLTGYSIRAAAKSMGIKPRLEGSPRHGGKWFWPGLPKVTVNRKKGAPE